MSTTTIRIEDDLKARLAVAAQNAGKTAHAFILDAIAQTVDQVEQDNAFNAVADSRWAAIQAGGKTVSWDAARTYLEARANAAANGSGQQARKPAARKPAALKRAK